jgi:ATP-dependent DNA ligase
VCRAALRVDAAAVSKLDLVAFDLLGLGGEDIRSLAWGKRAELLREAFPVGERLRLVQTQRAGRVVHDGLVALGFEGSVLKRPGVDVSPGATVHLA